MAKHFREESFFKLSGDKRKRLLVCCREGVENAEARPGITGGPNDYNDFKPYFDKVR
jgi:hypothetical protein